MRGPEPAKVERVAGTIGACWTAQFLARGRSVACVIWRPAQMGGRAGAILNRMRCLVS